MVQFDMMMPNIIFQETKRILDKARICAGCSRYEAPETGAVIGNCMKDPSGSCKQFVVRDPNEE